MTGALVRHKKMKNSQLCVASLTCTRARARGICPHVADFIKFFLGRPEKTPTWRLFLAP